MGDQNGGGLGPRLVAAYTLVVYPGLFLTLVDFAMSGVVIHSAMKI